MRPRELKKVVSLRLAPGGAGAKINRLAVGPLDHEGEFQRAWADPSNTQIELPPVDVNRVLAGHYRLSENLAFTRTMLWDMEVRKAWSPDRYIPSVVREGSARTWGQFSAADATESFVRSSQQRHWLDPAEYGRILEQVRLNAAQQKVTFIGAAEIPDRDGNLLRTGAEQPLFHVEHSVGGDESRPLNKWRIVHLTDEPDRRLVERFTVMANDTWLPEFIEIYIRTDLNIELTKRKI